jgi:hypothetical protein
MHVLIASCENDFRFKIASDNDAFLRSEQLLRDLYNSLTFNPYLRTQFTFDYV